MVDAEDERPAWEEWERAIDMLLEVQRTLAESVRCGQLEDHDHQIVGLPSGVGSSMPGGARVEAALHVVMAARHLIRQAVMGVELPGVPILQRAQNQFAIAGGYIAATRTTELSEHLDNRSK